MTNRDERRPGDERIVLRGYLETVTGLHVGSGYGSERTDATVVRDAWGNPFIPGSSFKGALRSTVERTIAGVAGVPFRTCQLADGPNSDCLTTNRTWQRKYTELQEAMSGVNFDEQKLVDFLNSSQGLCDTCRLFGSPFNQSRLLVKDLAWRPGKERIEEKRGEIRHGVGIDRDTQTARDQFKFDFEVLPSKLCFDVDLVLERPSDLDLALLAVGLQEMIHGFVPLGGIRSRGLGQCKLHLEQVQRVNLTDKKSLLAWLRGKDGGTPDKEVQSREAKAFLDDCFARLEKALT
ncbi:MAG: CRISPR-associated RAMP protein [Caldilineaceae bacterium]|nr:CRISPR-associated RAMP protein [Caldilineaceae bacterium]